MLDTWPCQRQDLSKRHLSFCQEVPPFHQLALSVILSGARPLQVFLQVTRGSAFSPAAPQPSQVLERDRHQLLQRSHATNNLQIVSQITHAVVDCMAL